MTEKPMRTLILNGSPRKKGDTVDLVQQLADGLKGEVVVINAYEEKISPCIDCRYCWSNVGCALDDGMSEIYKLIESVDNIVIASPIYFSELTGVLLGVLSRLQRYYAQRMILKDDAYAMKAKKGAVILVGGGDGSIEPALERAQIILRHVNASFEGCAISSKTMVIPAADDKKAAASIKEICGKLNLMDSSELFSN